MISEKMFHVKQTNITWKYDENRVGNDSVTEKGLKAAIAELHNGKKVSGENQEETYNALNKYAKNLNDMARKGKLDPVIGRDEEIRRVLQILSRRTKNNPILIGEAGVGKTAIAEGLAQRLVSGDIPENLKTKKLFSGSSLTTFRISSTQRRSTTGSRRRCATAAWRCCTSTRS